jgi:uncharacterized linocin/CFP29 family protein
MSQLNWTEAQWNRVNSAVTEEFTKASVAGAFLPCYGPLEGGAETVKEEIIDVNSATGVIRVSDSRNLPLWNLTVKVELSHQQVVDESLSSASLAFRRAANKLAKAEDYIILSGYSRSGPLVSPGAPRPFLLNLPNVAPSDLNSLVLSGSDHAIGLAEEGTVYNGVGAPGDRRGFRIVAPIAAPRGPNLVTTIAQAIALLEASSHPGPFTCVLGNQTFVDAHTPMTGSLVLPADRILPMLGGPLLRSSSIESDVGIVVSLAGDAIDIVVATPPTAQFLQISGDAKYLFRVYERFVLRIKDSSTPLNPGAVFTFHYPVP